MLDLVFTHSNNITLTDLERLALKRIRIERSSGTLEKVIAV